MDISGSVALSDRARHDGVANNDDICKDESWKRNEIPNCYCANGAGSGGAWLSGYCAACKEQ